MKLFIQNVDTVFNSILKFKQKLGTQAPSAFIPFQPSTFHNQQIYDPDSFQNYQQPSYAPHSSYNQYQHMQQYASGYQQQTYSAVQHGVSDLSSSTSRDTHLSVQIHSSTKSASNFYGNQTAQQS